MVVGVKVDFSFSVFDEFIKCRPPLAIDIQLPRAVKVVACFELVCYQVLFEFELMQAGTEEGEGGHAL